MPVTVLPVSRPATAASGLEPGHGEVPTEPHLHPVSDFPRRHIGPDERDVQAMLQSLGYGSLEALVSDAVPASIRLDRPLRLPAGLSEQAMLNELRALAAQNEVYRSHLGLGYYPCCTPAVLQRNILENPGWYTQYTPYQAEISQGRLEALLNFQTLVTDLTAMDIANASLLDEATSAAEAVTMALHLKGEPGRTRLLAASTCHPQTLAVVRTRAEPLGIEVVEGDWASFQPDASTLAVLLQYPDTVGAIHDYADLARRTQAAGGLVIVATDLLALTLLRPPGEWGADVVVGSAQRFGMPLGAGGPHAGFFATREACKRAMPGRLVGVSRDAQGRSALRLSLQTREQHIRRDKATSNICTAQVLPAVVAAMYAAYHGPRGLRAIAERVHFFTRLLEIGLHRIGFHTARVPVFDTLSVDCGSQGSDGFVQRALARRVNLRRLDERRVGISLDETTTVQALDLLIEIFGGTGAQAHLEEISGDISARLPGTFARTSAYLQAPAFNTHHSETEMLRYLKRLENRDLSLTTSMIPLGSCTMKLNAAAEMMPISWPELAHVHPFAPADQQRGYAAICRQLESWLAECTGFTAVSLQPNAGSSGEYAGLMAIRAAHRAQGRPGRTVCLIPVSAHGTNPATAVMAGMSVVPVACDARGNIDLADLRAKAAAHREDLAAIMVTYPSTHGVFEESIREVCRVVHEHGGFVYMDGANMNAQVGLTSPGCIGADICHLNLHKTFCIPHGGGGPGMGPVCASRSLAPYLPGHPFGPPAPHTASGAVAAAPWGSALVLTIPWAYIRMMGHDGLARASALAILNANYISRRLAPAYPTVYRGERGLVAHECILDCRPFKAHGIEVEDVAKRLMDYGFHAPTMSWPVPGTLMVEPTESESLAELDRFCEAMLSIAAEVREVAEGRMDRANNPLKNAPHTAEVLLSDRWERPYSRELAAFPSPWTRSNKFWPAVSRVDNVYGDRNLVCSCSVDPA